MTNFKNRNVIIDLYRLFLALSVLSAHFSFLTPHEDFLYNLWLPAQDAVYQFFILAGFYSQSTISASGPLNFVKNRFKRIYPAYFLVIIISGIVFSVIAIENNVEISIVNYFLSNLVFLNFLAPGVSESQSIVQLNVINGSLWSIKYEFFMFVVFGITNFFRFRGVKYAIPLVAILFMYMAASLGLPVYLEVLLYFYIGIIVKKFSYDILLICIGLLILCFDTNIFLNTIMFLTILVLSKYCNIPLKFNNISYEIYLLHFPIIQIYQYYFSYLMFPADVQYIHILSITVVFAKLLQLITKRINSAINR